MIASATALVLLAAAPAPDPSALPPTMQCLLRAYPEHLCGGTPDAVRWCDGTETPWDDGRTKSPSERIAAPDLEDTLATPYPAGRAGMGAPPFESDPGRARHEPLFDRMYGASRKAVRATTRKIPWAPSADGGTLTVTTVNGVDRALERVGRDLAKLPEDQRRFVAETSGAFVWRTIRGTDRRSAHSWGIAVDVGVPLADYWRWRKPDPKTGRIPYRNRFPAEVVAIFERHGFIWGGKWYHFDTMHFEYRPELLDPACRAPAPSAP